MPTHASIPITSLVANYRATDFLLNFMQFLKLSPNTSHSAKVPTATLGLPLYKCVMVRLPTAPQVTTSITKDIIHTCPATPTWGLTSSAVPDQFDTVLVRESDPEESTVRHPLHSEHPFSILLCTWDTFSDLLIILGLTVGQVQVTFSVPEQYGSFPEPVTYVEWFTQFGKPIPDLGMYQVSGSSCHHHRHASIIPVSQIEHCVYLIPKFGRVMDRTWATDNVLELCKKFYVNCYFHHLDFLLFCYLLS